MDSEFVLTVDVLELEFGIEEVEISSGEIDSIAPTEEAIFLALPILGGPVDIVPDEVARDILWTGYTAEEDPGNAAMLASIGGDWHAYMGGG